MATNAQIRRAKPTVDSPLGRRISGQIDQAQYEQEMAAKRWREQPRLTDSLARLFDLTRGPLGP
jgi:hypothetical protein